MKRTIVVRPAADRDLDEQAEYIARRHNPETALLFYSAAQETFALIATQPHMGRTRSFRNPAFAGVRMCLMKHFDKYLVLYRLLDGGIEVLRVIHGARDIESLFG